MADATLAPGHTLPTYRVSATMPAETTENKIHEDDLARRFGFRGGLVPGVTVYAWMTHPVVEALGAEWLERGTFRARFASPVYFDEVASIESIVAASSGDGVSIDVRAVNAAGDVCATGTFGLAAGSPPDAPDPAGYPAAPLPAPESRPRVSREVLAAHPILGTPDVVIDAATARAFVDRVREPLAMYSGAGAAVHPGLYLHEANRALSRNVIVSPWIHVESEGRHIGPIHVGERLETRAKVASLTERKGHHFVELDLLLVAAGHRPVAHVFHRAIYQLRGAGTPAQ
jgi:acyl dehydratase